MEIVIELLKEYGIYLLTSTGIFLSILFGRPKTAEKLEKQKQKQEQKLIKKAHKFADKAIGIYERLDPKSVEIANEIVDIHEPWLDEVYKNG